MLLTFGDPVHFCNFEAFTMEFERKTVSPFIFLGKSTNPLQIANLLSFILDNKMQCFDWQVSRHVCVKSMMLCFLDAFVLFIPNRRSDHRLLDFFFQINWNDRSTEVYTPSRHSQTLASQTYCNVPWNNFQNIIRIDTALVWKEPFISEMLAATNRRIYLIKYVP